MLFDNNQIDSDSLPKVENLIFHPLQTSYLKVSLISNIILWLVIGTGASIFYFFKSDEFPTILRFLFPIVIIALALLSFLLIILGFKKKSYAMRQNDIIFKTGLLWQKEIALPFNRVQHCEVAQGPIERIFNLSELKVFTAGGASSDLNIPGLSPEEAKSMKEFIVNKTIIDEEE